MKTIPFPGIQTALARLSFESGASHPRLDRIWAAGWPCLLSDRRKVVTLHVEIDQDHIGYRMIDAIVRAKAGFRPRHTPPWIGDDGQRLTIHFFLVGRSTIDDACLRILYTDPLGTVHGTEGPRLGDGGRAGIEA
jgi:hypothetical protein